MRCPSCSVHISLLKTSIHSLKSSLTIYQIAQNNFHFNEPQTQASTGRHYILDRSSFEIRKIIFLEPNLLKRRLVSDRSSTDSFALTGRHYILDRSSTTEKAWLLLFFHASFLAVNSCLLIIPMHFKLYIKHAKHQNPSTCIIS